MATSGIVDRVRRPEYTGENRCIPCTATNAVIAVVLAAVVGTLWLPVAGVAVLALSLGAIWLRGYLVPYTPSLTKRYFPDRVLRWFDKAPEHDAPVAGAEADVDPEPILLEAGAIELVDGGADLRATEAFAAAWREEVETLRADGDLADRIAGVVDADPADVEIDELDPYTLVIAAGRQVARWESRAALVADMAALPLLAERVPGWETLDRRVQGSLLNGMRVFLERCPDCGSDVAFSRDTRESCCRSVEVVVLECGGCEARLLEVEAD